ncbi:glycosyltransferase family 2 protein [Natribacillus halophilus]|uniref:Glycosyl transferase family 2 n=1 Tax=Natribacillus halophilus TaxID=549003 RepID=A0A1G8P2M5_9BACI|nr:glycosyltransferase [Natribacillus halophilus]SDI86506.1 Glycosyl transferase family 2 [Natribacillus halophilus]
MISVLTCTNRPHMMNNIFANYAQQELEQKELILILNQDEMDINIWKREAKKYPNVSVYQLPARMSVSACKNFGVQKATYDYMAKFDDDDYYAPRYLTTVRDAFTEKQADIVGKSSIYYYFTNRNALGLFPSNSENSYTTRVADSTLAFKKDVCKHVRFTPMKMGSDSKFQKDCRMKGFTIYSTARYDHVAIRGGASHTWNITDEQLMKQCTALVYTKDYHIDKKKFSQSL